MRARWRERVGNRPVSYLLVADDPERSGWLRVLGPASVDAPIRSVDAAALAHAIGDTAGMGALECVRHLAEEIARLGGEGLHLEGLLSRHTVEVRLKENAAMWADATTVTSSLRPSDGWRAILTKLGYGLEQLPTRGHLARHEGRPVLVVHPKNSPRAFARLDDQGRPPEGLLARDCHAAGTRYGLLAHEGRFRRINLDDRFCLHQGVEQHRSGCSQGPARPAVGLPRSHCFAAWRVVRRPTCRIFPGPCWRRSSDSRRSRLFVIPECLILPSGPMNRYLWVSRGFDILLRPQADGHLHGV